MRIEYHPSVRQDVTGAMRRYRSVSERLAKDFKAELRRVISIAADNPSRFHRVKPGFHRANLTRFPYHFVYRQIAGGIRVTLVQHHRRHPEAGMDRE